MNLTLSDLLKIKGVRIINAAKIQNKVFKGVSIDSRKCRKHEIFAAIKGERFDGHNFIREIFKNGVTAALVSKQWFSQISSNRFFKNKTFIVVNDTTTGLGEIAKIHRSKFIIPFLAIAGSNGKTSTRDIIAHVLSKKYKVLKTEANFNNAIGVPLTLFRLNKTHQLCVIELGTNHFGEIAYLCRIAKPQFGLITNIGKEHLEFLKDIKGAAKAECELIDYLKQIYGTFFLNTDDKYLVQKSRNKSMNVFTYGTKGNTEVEGKITKYKTFYPEAKIKNNRNIINAKLNIAGFQGFQSALAAAAIGLYFEISKAVIQKAISEFRLVTAKRNQIKQINGVWFIDDTYNSNPDSVKMALENMSKYKIKGKKHIVLGDMLELGKSSKKEHFAMGKLAKAHKFENLYTYGNDSYYTFKGAKGIKNNYYFQDKKTLAEFLNMNIRKGDAVLVKGSRSVKMEEIINQLTVNG